MPEVLSREGLPILTDFAGGKGTPLVVNTTYGRGYVLKDDNTIVPLGGRPINVLDFNGIDPNGNNDSTSAFNAALASGQCVYAPSGTYALTSLANITGNMLFYGDGRATKLIFNTTGVGIHLNHFPSEQHFTVVLQGLSFDNVTGVPAAFIRNRGYLNTVIEKCYFNDCAATYCIDNEVAINEYSYAFGIENCDLTRISGTGVVCETSNMLKVSKSVIEGCGGKGIVTSTNGSGVSDLYCDAVYFESNTGYDIDLGTDGSSYWGRALLNDCWFAGSPTLNLGAKSKVTFVGIQGSGGDHLVVSGSANAEAHFLGCESSNFDQSGSFLWSDPQRITAYTPTITNVTTSSVAGQYIRHGSLVTFTCKVTVSAAPTGDITISLPIAATFSQANVTVGTASGVVAGTYYIGTAWLFTSSTLKIHTHGVGLEWNAANPDAWVNGNNFDLTVTYIA
jgi:hypothetical protein